MLRRGPLVVISVGLVGAVLSVPESGNAQEGQGAVEGIPVTSELVVRNCSRCHQQDDDGRMSRISYLRKTPEGWSQSIRRMVSLNDVSVDPEDAREIVRYLANRHGLAPEELRPAFWEVERRHLTERPEMSEVVRRTCTACHTLGRIATQRRTPEEWELVTETHRGLYPLIDRQRFRRGSVPEEEGDFEFPVDAAVARLAEQYPLETRAWSDWSRNMRPARIEGRWAVRGREVGRGPLYGTVTVSADGPAREDFTTSARYLYPAEDRTVERSGEATVYTGYQWRGSSNGTGGEHTELREVMFVERDWNEMYGRWFTGAYEEIGVDVEMVRIGSAPVVLGAYPEKAVTGAEERIRIFGANLPESLGAQDVDLGAGVEILGVDEVASDRATLRIRVEEGAPAGARDVVIAGARADRALVVYEAVDYIRVEPHPAIARTGGGNFAPGYARFEAVGFAVGPDGERDTDDDIRIGVVDASWSLVEYPRTWDDDDVDFVGEIDQDGRFTPAVDGPNPERSGLRNNIGEVWVRAEHRREGAPMSEAPLRARGFLVVSPPSYIEWEPRAEVVNTIQEGGNR
ncbi:MAG: quinohemoprotein amine dehydrogenase subunit alpha [Gemmatimonadota bacterium]|nr:quinohemoprotein amine dehydrogenase subunit alpha [Gemmatimonadota bacterium]